jgi:hypothetical protein
VFEAPGEGNVVYSEVGNGNVVYSEVCVRYRVTEMVCTVTCV